MPRKNSTTWSPNNPITAVRLEDFNEDIDDIYLTWSDNFKVYRLTWDPALQVRIGAGTYRVGWIEWQYAGGTITVGASVTTYIMINSAWVIQTSTSAWDGQYARLAVVVSGASTITSITDWRNKIIGGDFWGNPTWVILMWTTGTAPTWYLLCDWSAISRTTYAGLFWVIWTTYWTGDGSTTFNLPNLKGRVPVGFDVGQTEFDTLWEKWGAKTHTLWITEIPSHSHSINTRVSSAWIDWFVWDGSYTDYSHTASTNTAWGGLAHNNLQPYLTLNFIIKT